MLYRFETTVPSFKIKTVDDYKKRVREIVKGQMREIIQPYRFMNVYFWLFAMFFLSFTSMYTVLCVLELIMDTLLLPLFLVPYVRVIPNVLAKIIWSMTIAIGCFSFINLCYDLNEPLWIPKKKNKIS